MFNKTTGFIFIALAGLFYTLERGFSLLSTSIIKASFYAGQNTGAVPNAEMHGILSNLFVPFFLISGIIIIIYDARKNENNE